jgi:hypothetical protein
LLSICVNALRALHAASSTHIANDRRVSERSAYARARKGGENEVGSLIKACAQCVWECAVLMIDPLLPALTLFVGERGVPSKQECSCSEFCH